MCEERGGLIGYLYDECDAEERRRLAAHLETCEGCRAELAGLRGVRQHLLAWEVPEHESVWKPFAPARVAPSWRDVPAWALAAAAAGVFAVGAAGGFVARAVVPAAPVQAAAVPPAGATSADLAALEKRLLGQVRAEMDQRIAPVSAHDVGPVGTNVSSADMMRRVEQLISASEERQSQRSSTYAVSLFKDLSSLRASNDRSIAAINYVLAQHDQQLRQLPQQSGK